MIDKDADTVVTITFSEFNELVCPKILSRDPCQEIMKMFDLFDEEGKGGISFQNLKNAALEIGESFTDEELREMITEADRDGDGMINREEFYRVMKKKNGSALDELSSDEED